MNPLAEAVINALDDEALDALVDRLADRLAERFEARPVPDEEEWMDSAAAASYLGLSKPALYKLTAARRIPFYQEGPGCKCWFKRSELDRWRRRELDQGRDGGRASLAEAAISLPRRSTRRDRVAAV